MTNPYLSDEAKAEFLRQYTLQAYQAQAARTSMRNKHSSQRLTVAVMGLTSEVGELNSEIKHAIEQDRQMDEALVREELGDCAWYLSEICTIMGWSLAEIALENIAKLERRHPNGFSAETSMARMDKVVK